jgi:hypothetical protein
MSTIVFITDDSLSLINACKRCKNDILKVLPGSEFVSFKYINDISKINISSEYTEAILINAYPSLNSYYFVKNSNSESEYLFIFDPITTLEKNNKICKNATKKFKNLNKQYRILLLTNNRLNTKNHILIGIIIIVYLHIGPFSGISPHSSIIL